MSDTVSGGVQEGTGAANQRVHAAAPPQVDHAHQTQDALGEVRGVIRSQPITAALVVFAIGYLFGRLGSLIPSASSRRRA